MTDINISGFDNEDIDRQYTLKTGTRTSSVPYNLTGCSLSAAVKNQSDTLITTLSSPSNGIVITDAANGLFTVHIPRGTIPYQAGVTYKYDLLLTTGSSVRRLWGGKVIIQKGITVPA